ncbi:MAG: bifunctional DNA-formamidopyrimidine glycosylase/DNA-(apurinic or apyrimidinic site) lyase [Gemmatimonadetes bacterium]|nr:bifunctional DNA-formamidopyrimidine glycosylase/DNA-(apurinic or apyrimidinic site) lyase [Gemmatimonadota bacterium]
MPELPETETIARDLDAAMRGARIVGMRAPHADVLREMGARGFAARVTGLAVEAVTRRAKLVVLELEGGDRIAVQPRFTGALLLDPTADLDDGYVCVRWPLSDGRTLVYRDVRRLGTVACMSPARWAAYEGALGPEPLDASFDGGALHARLARSRRPVKVVLMDQRALAGVGNIYATESLWRARVDPSRAASSLTAAETDALALALREILTASIVARGTTFRDYRDARGGRGAFAAQLEAYGRAGEPCTRCGARLASTMAIDGRTTVFCAWCQR